MAQKFYADYEDDLYPGLLEKLDHIVKAILELIERKSNKELYEIPWYEK